MAVTVQQIFDIAIHLMDSQNESTGSTETADTKEYRLRTVSLLNSVLDRAFPYSDNYRDALEAAGGKRPICPKVTEMVDTQYQKAMDLLKTNEEKLHQLAQYLYEHETITGREFMEILEGQREV